MNMQIHRSHLLDFYFILDTFDGFSIAMLNNVWRLKEYADGKKISLGRKTYEKSATSYKIDIYIYTIYIKWEIKL